MKVVLSYNSSQSLLRAACGKDLEQWCHNVWVLSPKFYYVGRLSFCWEIFFQLQNLPLEICL